MLTDRQKQLIEIYVRKYPELAELEEKAHLSLPHLKTLGNAMAMKPYPPSVSGSDALEIGKIGLAQ